MIKKTSSFCISTRIAVMSRDRVKSMGTDTKVPNYFDFSPYLTSNVDFSSNEYEVTSTTFRFWESICPVSTFTLRVEVV